MLWNEQRRTAKRRHAARYDRNESEQYYSIPGMGFLTSEQLDAHWTDIEPHLPYHARMKVLDVGAGTGAMTSVLQRLPEASITVLEPSSGMLELLRSRPEFKDIASVEGFCDAAEDQSNFATKTFDLIACRQVVNGLFDPLEAFRNWHFWLKPNGRLLILEALFGRDGWTGFWQEEVDVLPLSCCQSMGTIPYLLESIGFEIEAFSMLNAVNALPSTRTKRYLVVARKP